MGVHPAPIPIPNNLALEKPMDFCALTQEQRMIYEYGDRISETI